MKPRNQKTDRRRHTERHGLISNLAYALYEQEGKPEGRAWEHWFNAEAMVESQFGQGTKP